MHAVAQSQKAVPAYFTSKHILPSGFAEQHDFTQCGNIIPTYTTIDVDHTA